jgi:hypothetical protein
MSGMLALDTPRYLAFHTLVFNPERMKLLNKNVLKNYTHVILHTCNKMI